MERLQIRMRSWRLCNMTFVIEDWSSVVIVPLYNVGIDKDD